MFPGATLTSTTDDRWGQNWGVTTVKSPWNDPYGTYTTPSFSVHRNSDVTTVAAGNEVVFGSHAPAGYDARLDALWRQLNQPQRHQPLPTEPHRRAGQARPALAVRPVERILRVQHRAA